MIFHPAIIALILSSIFISFLMTYSSYFSFVIQRKWNLKSGSDLQLTLERRTYLVSTILPYVFAFQILSFFLYIYTADQLHNLFVGAMCAAGSLYVNGYGYPTLILKVFNFLLAGLWLILNYVDNKGYDYPLLKSKYAFLLFMTPFILAEVILQANYFFRLKPEIITSCCGTLFSGEGKSLAANIVALPSLPMKIAFYLSMFLALLSGIYFYRRGRGGYLFAGVSAITFVISLLSILSFISVYIYELPTHHCPFCILQGEYAYIGYPLYFTLIGAGIAGMGVGVLMPFRGVRSLAAVIHSFQKKLALISLVLLMLFAGMATYRMVFTDFILDP